MAKTEQQVEVGKLAEGKEAAAEAEAQAPARPVLVEGITQAEVGKRETEAVKAGKTALSVAGKMTDSLKALALSIIRIRACFLYDGAPDWAGKSQACRTAVSETFQKAGISEVPPDGVVRTPDEVKKIRDLQSSLRYHYRTALRTVMTEHYGTEDAAKVASEAAGMQWETAADRAKAAGKARTAGDGTGVPGQVGGIKVTEAVGAHAVAMVRSMAEQDQQGCVQEALSIVRTARQYGMPDTAEDRAMLALALAALVGEAQSWAGDIGSYVAPVAGEPEDVGAVA